MSDVAALWKTVVPGGIGIPLLRAGGGQVTYIESNLGSSGGQPTTLALASLDSSTGALRWARSLVVGPPAGQGFPSLTPSADGSGRSVLLLPTKGIVTIDGLTVDAGEIATVLVGLDASGHATWAQVVGATKDGLVATTGAIGAAPDGSFVVTAYAGEAGAQLGTYAVSTQWLWLIGRIDPAGTWQSASGAAELYRDLTVAPNGEVYGTWTKKYGRIDDATGKPAWGAPLVPDGAVVPNPNTGIQAVFAGAHGLTLLGYVQGSVSIGGKPFDAPTPTGLLVTLDPDGNFFAGGASADETSASSRSGVPGGGVILSLAGGKPTGGTGPGALKGKTYTLVRHDDTGALKAQHTVVGCFTTVDAGLSIVAPDGTSAVVASRPDGAYPGFVAAFPM